jgi:pimeloyl-ACP methyl ester carboxylesterase
MASSSQRPHLLLIPGLLCTADLFAAQTAALSPLADISVADHTGEDSMAALARSILARAPRRFALAGLSMGGYIAFEILRQAPERVTRLALLDTNARADRPEQSDQRRQLVELAKTHGLGAVQAKLTPLLLSQSRSGDRRLGSRLVAMAEETGVAAFERQETAIMGRPDYRPMLPEIRCPTLIVVGAEDTITPVKVAQEIARGIPGSRLEVIPDCGHLSTLEQPDTVSRLLAAWLTS